jgi:hypothetical protein
MHNNMNILDEINDSTDQVSTGGDRDEPPTTLIDTGSLVAKEEDAAMIVNEQDEYEIDDDDEDEDTVGNPDGCCPRCCSLICPSCCTYFSHRSVLYTVFYRNCICA